MLCMYSNVSLSTKFQWQNMKAKQLNRTNQSQIYGNINDQIFKKLDMDQ